jgi:mitochondrial chaperone BCS1
MASEATTITKAMSSTFQNMLTAAASLAGSAMLARTVVNNLIPYELQEFLLSRLEFLRYRFSSSEVTAIVEELDGYNNNLVFEAAATYLSTIISPTVRRIKISQHTEESSLRLSLERGEEVVDVYDGMSFKWRMVCQRIQGARDEDGSRTREARFELTFLKRYRDKAVSDYVPYIQKKAKLIKDKDRTLRLFMNNCGFWNPINLRHPATFETLAMDAKEKKKLMDDLARFTTRKEYYKRIGKAWKRGYLLYGPPGTGKSSLVGAMANYLRFDIYDLELSSVKCNSDLKRMLVNTPSRSILVIEDIDCAIDLQNRDDRSKPQINRNEEKVS